MVDAHSATAADFERAAQGHANSFWRWLTFAGLVWWFTSIWWAALPGPVALLCAYLSFGATGAARELRTGNYRVWNPNNGVSHGEAANRDFTEEPNPSGPSGWRGRQTGNALPFEGVVKWILRD